MNSIKCKNLSKSFYVGDNKIDVLNNINLSINEADLVAISGESGAGKSTLLHILASLDKPSDGEIFYDGHSINTFNNTTLSKHRLLNFGFVYQFHHLLEDMTILENVLLPNQYNKSDKKFNNEEIFNLLEKVGLSERLHHLPWKLSGGEKQRAAIVRAIVNKPNFLFLDEPTGNLDESNAKSIQELLINLSKDLKFSLITSSHDIEFIKMMDLKYEIINRDLIYYD